MAATGKTRPLSMNIPTPSSASSPGSVASPMSTDSIATSSTSDLTLKPANIGLQPASMPSGIPLPPKTSITSKEWIIPPRPKPGRKPATDTPPTKRKAQNRAAQRAFRERRAARVGELEEQLDEQRDESDRVHQQLRDQVRDLDGVVEALRRQCADLEETLAKERSEKSEMAKELESLRRQRLQTDGPDIMSSRNEVFMPRYESNSTLTLHQTSHRGSLGSNGPDARAQASAFSISHMISPPDSTATSRDPPSNCDNCTLGSKCECLQSIANNISSEPDQELKRRPSSISVLEPEEKRMRPDYYPNEVDFTSMFSKKDTIADPTPAEPPQQLMPPRDSCGFCTESSYCMCAEAAAAAQTLAPMAQQVQTPPASENDVGPSPMEVTSTGAIKLPSISSLNPTAFRSPRKPAGRGANGPGTCSQCLRDPKSGLFCRSLASKFSRETGKTGGDGCCGGSAAGSGGCCKSQDAVPSSSSTSSVQDPGLSLSCADAYKTLSSHPGFEQASDEIDTWLPKLKAIPKSTGNPGRTPLDVETASIMSVLKEFDVRFGRNW